MTLVELDSLLRTFQIPEMRRNLTEDNLRWLNRNLPIQNGNHPKLQEAMREIVQKLRGNK